MDETNNSTEHRKGQHLTSEERHEIEVRLNKDKWSIYKIAKRPSRTRSNAEPYCSTTARSNAIRPTSATKPILKTVRKAAGNTVASKPPLFSNMWTTISMRTDGRWMPVWGVPSWKEHSPRARSFCHGFSLPIATCYCNLRTKKSYSGST